MTAELEALVQASWKEAVSFGTMTEAPRLDADSMFEDVFKEMPEHLQRQRALMRAERQPLGRSLSAMANMNMIQALNSAMDIMLMRNPSVVHHGRGHRLFRRSVSRHRGVAAQVRRASRHRHAHRRGRHRRHGHRHEREWPAAGRRNSIRRLYLSGLRSNRAANSRASAIAAPGSSSRRSPFALPAAAASAAARRIRRARKGYSPTSAASKW